MDTPIRILFLAWGYSIHGERRIRVFADDPAFSVAYGSPFDYELANARYFRLPDPPSPSGTVQALGGLARALHRVRAIAAESRPQLVFLQTLLYPSFLGLALPASLPTLITFWNGDLLSWNDSTGLERLLKRRIVRYGLRKAAAVTVNSEAARQVCLREGARRENVHVIRYPGIDLTRFYPMDKAKAKRAIGLAAHPVILNERGTAAHKNSDMLVRAAPLVLSQFPQARFVFLSPEKGASAEAFSVFRRLARELGVDYAMIWRGHVPYDELPQMVNAADAWVSLSSEDSMPNSMLDAMACGIPIISADLPQIREWISEGRTGCLVDPKQPAKVADTICRVLAQPDWAQQMARRAGDLLRGHADSPSQVTAIKTLARNVVAR